MSVRIRSEREAIWEWTPRDPEKVQNGLVVSSVLVSRCLYRFPPQSREISRFAFFPLFRGGKSPGAEGQVTTARGALVHEKVRCPSGGGGAEMLSEVTS